MSPIDRPTRFRSDATQHLIHGTLGATEVLLCCRALNRRLLQSRRQRLRNEVPDDDGTDDVAALTRAPNHWRDVLHERAIAERVFLVL